MDVNVIVTCYNREAYWPYLQEVLASYQKLKPQVCLAYNGDDKNFPCQVRIQNRGHQAGDHDLTKAGYEFLRPNGVARWIKIGIDSWLLDEEVLLRIFRQMEEKQKCFAGCNWFSPNDLSTDIFLVDTRFGNPLEALTCRGDSYMEAEMFTAVTKVGGYLLLEERHPVHHTFRFECPSLGWVGYHTLEENLEAKKRLMGL